MLWECLDPRLGGRADMWVTSSVPTFGQINQTTRAFWIANPGCDSNNLFFTANGPMSSPAELGNLPLPNQPWRSISLFGTNLHPVLDMFAVQTNTDPSAVYATNALRGRVNLNSARPSSAQPYSRNLYPLASVFDGVPVEEYPGGPVLNKLSIEDARTIADILSSGPIMLNVSDIGRVGLDSYLLQGSSCGTFLQTKQRREALLGKVANLLTVRQNIFTIVLAAELAGQESGRVPRLPVRQRAVAIVWRDPYLNEFFVRSFRYLGD